MLTSQELKDAGIKPGPLFGKCLQMNSLDEALAFIKENTKTDAHKSMKMISGSIWEYLCKHPHFSGIPSIEISGKIASNSEKRRWIEQGAVCLNATTDWKPDDLIPTVVKDGDILYQIYHLILFPNSKRKITFVQTITKIQNIPTWDIGEPTIKIIASDGNFNSAYMNWVSGKNPTDSPEWKKGVFAS